MQISKETMKVKSLLPQFNTCLLAVEGPDSTGLLLEEALDPVLLSTMIQPSVSFCSKSKQDLIEALVMTKRRKKEMSMIEKEMRKTTKYYLNKHEVVQLLIKKYSEEEVLEFGKEQCHFYRTTVVLLMNSLKSVPNYFPLYYHHMTKILTLTKTKKMKMMMMMIMMRSFGFLSVIYCFPIDRIHHYFLV